MISRHALNLVFYSEEVSEDVRTRMHAIQENEITQLRDLTALLNLEFQFLESYLEVLRDVKNEWVDEYVFSSPLTKYTLFFRIEFSDIVLSFV